MLSPSILRQTLLQSTIEPSLRDTLAKTFAFHGPGWPLLELLGERKPWLPSRDPVLLALRRLGWPELGELSAMHRFALTKAGTRPYGFLHLVLEEIAALVHPGDPPPVRDDEAFEIFFALAVPGKKFAHEKKLFDLRARGLAYAARRQMALGQDHDILFGPLVESRLGYGTGDPELELFLVESLARSLEVSGDLPGAIRLHMSGLNRLTARDAFAPVKLLDRLAESLADLSDLICRHSPGHPEAEDFSALAKSLLGLFDPGLNQPLRRRLAPL